MRIGAIFLSCAALCASAPGRLHAQGGLSPESRDEFRRVYGANGANEAPPSPSARQPALASRTLQPQSVSEFARVFGSNVLQGTAQLQHMTTPATIDSTILTTLTKSTDQRKYVVLWHLVAVDLTAIDHRATLNASPATYHEQFGPARTARALALIHQAIFEAENVFDLKYTSTLRSDARIDTTGASKDAAVTEAAYQVILWLYPGLKDQSFKVDAQGQFCTSAGFSIDTYYTCALQSIPDGLAKDAGLQVGRAIAGRLVAERSHDGSDRLEPIWGKDFVPNLATGDAFTQWQADPVSALQTALGAWWGSVTPFGLTSGAQFRPSEDHEPTQVVRSLGTDANGRPLYQTLKSYNAIRQFGGEPRLDAAVTGKAGLPLGDNVFVAQFWAYDGTANVCAPARLYNQIAGVVLDKIAAGGGVSGVIDTQSPVDVARYYALVNFAMADASIAAWDGKFHFQFPRPVTYIRANDASGAGVAGLYDPPKWFPLGAQNTNSDQPFNITPPFPSYPSGHAVFGGALFGILRQFLASGTHWSFQSDEFNGKNKDVFNYTRCSASDPFTPQATFCKERDFTIDCAERENADSRLFMGVHWVFDADDGIEMGNRVARQTYLSLMRPLDAQGLGIAPVHAAFSVLPAGVRPRSGLVCAGVHYPAGWDDGDPTKGFGVLDVRAVM